MTVVVSRGYRWVAEGDGIAHAARDRGHPIRTLCGRSVVDERFARPAVVRCDRCREVAEGKT